MVRAENLLQLSAVPVLDSGVRDALTEPVFDKSARDSKYRIQTWAVSQSRHISRPRRASLVTVTKELICVNWSEAHTYGSGKALCPEAGIERMPKNISPRYKKNYKGTNKTRGLCRCEEWRCRRSACAPARLSCFSIQGLWGVALQSCTCAPSILELQRLLCSCLCRGGTGGGEQSGTGETDWGC